MLVKMKTMMCGPDGNYNVDQVADFDAARANALVDGGFATLVGAVPVAAPPAAMEVATITAPETATARNQKPVKRGRHVA